MLDLLFRLGNPTNKWMRRPGLRIAVDLSASSINAVELGRAFGTLEFLGRDEDTTAAKCDSFRYYSLGLEIDRGSNDSIDGFSLVVNDPEGHHHPFAGEVTWLDLPINLKQVRQKDLSGIFGDWYWIDTDDEETIVFYEFKEYEIQIECDLECRVSRVIVTREPLMASNEQRTAYGVTKPYPF